MDESVNDDEKSTTTQSLSQTSMSMSTSYGKRLGIHFESSVVRRIITKRMNLKIRLGKKFLLGMSIVIDLMIRKIITSAILHRPTNKKRFTERDFVLGLECNEYHRMLGIVIVYEISDFAKQTVYDMLSQFYPCGQISTSARNYILSSSCSILRSVILMTNNFYTNRGKSTLTLEDCVWGSINFLESTNMLNNTIFEDLNGLLTLDEIPETYFEDKIREMYSDQKFGAPSPRKRKTPIPLSTVRELILDIVSTERVSDDAKKFLEWFYILLLKRIMHVCDRIVEEGKTLTREIAFLSISTLFKRQIFLV